MAGLGLVFFLSAARARPPPANHTGSAAGESGWRTWVSPSVSGGPGQLVDICIGPICKQEPCLAKVLAVLRVGLALLSGVVTVLVIQHLNKRCVPFPNALTESLRTSKAVA
jgi:hypothetical protein